MPKKPNVKKITPKRAASKNKLEVPIAQPVAVTPPLPLRVLLSAEAKRVEESKHEEVKAALPNVSAQLKEQKSEAGEIWEEIKNKPISMFGLPGQFVELHCTPVTVEPSKLYLTIRSQAVLPSLEAALGSAFSVEMADKFVIVARVAKSTIKK